MTRIGGKKPGGGYGLNPSPLLVEEKGGGAKTHNHLRTSALATEKGKGKGKPLTNMVVSPPLTQRVIHFYGIKGRGSGSPLSTLGLPVAQGALAGAREVVAVAQAGMARDTLDHRSQPPREKKAIQARDLKMPRVCIRRRMLVDLRCGKAFLTPPPGGEGAPGSGTEKGCGLDKLVWLPFNPLDPLLTQIGRRGRRGGSWN